MVLSLVTITNTTRYFKEFNERRFYDSGSNCSKYLKTWSLNCQFEWLIQLSAHQSAGCVCMVVWVKTAPQTQREWNYWEVWPCWVRWDLVKASVSLGVGFGLTEAEAIPSVTLSSCFLQLRIQNSQPTSQAPCLFACCLASHHDNNELNSYTVSQPQLFSFIRIAMAMVPLHSQWNLN